MLRKRTLIGLIFLFILGFASPLWAQSGASIQYGYDALGRLTQVMDPSGNVATYNYDAAGNLDFKLPPENFNKVLRRPVELAAVIGDLKYWNCPITGLIGT